MMFFLNGFQFWANSFLSLFLPFCMPFFLLDPSVLLSPHLCVLAHHPVLLPPVLEVVEVVEQHQKKVECDMEDYEEADDVALLVLNICIRLEIGEAHDVVETAKQHDLVEVLKLVLLVVAPRVCSARDNHSKDYLQD
jgi:hypothetical protein